MKFFYDLERKFGRYAIHNLMYYIIILYVIGYVINLAVPGFYWYALSLNAGAILRGQVWRLVTFVIYPPTFSPIFLIFALYCYYSLGASLERVWGAFRFNVYIFMGILGHIVAEFVFYFLTGMSAGLTTSFLNASVFFAFAANFPDEHFYLYFLIPIRVKWLAIAEGAIYILMFLTGSITTKLEVGLSMANFVIFFVMTRNYRRFTPKEVKRRTEFKTQIRPKNRTRHTCAVCGRTDEDSPGMEFRYCSKCEGNYEYCMDHLYTHKHIKSPERNEET